MLSSRLRFFISVKLTKQQEDGSVSNISEHDSEEEGEGNDGEETGVDLSVSWGTIGIDDFL